MSFTMRLPSINAGTTEGQMAQMRGYLYQMAQELEFALNSLEVGSVNVSAESGQIQTSREQKALENFSDIKSLIIKSADILNAYSDQIEKKFQGKYTAASEFGTFTESAMQKVSANERGITQLLKSTQTLEGSLGELQEIISDSYIRSGKLYENPDGTYVYGLEIGQNNFVNGEEVFRKFARFTADKLSFYDKNGTEVAYISDSMLNITGAKISSRLIAGEFDVDFTDGIAFKWIGG